MVECSFSYAMFEMLIRRVRAIYTNVYLIEAHTKKNLIFISPESSELKRQKLAVERKIKYKNKNNNNTKRLKKKKWFVSYE